MALDELVKNAAKNGGKATKQLNHFPGFGEQKQQPSCPTQTTININKIEVVTSSPPTSQHTTEIALKQGETNLLPPSGLTAQPMGQLEVMEQNNRIVRTLKESHKNHKEQAHRNNVSYAFNNLGYKQPIPLTTKITPSTESIYLPKCLIKIADEISAITGLNVIGICLAILSCISIATWGRVSVRLDKNWLEPTILMLMQVSSAGTKKSAAAAILRKPFDDFSSNKNIGREQEIQLNSKQSTLIEKAVDKLISKKIQDIIKEDGINTNTLESVKNIIETDTTTIQNHLAPSKNKTIIRPLIDNATSFGLCKSLSEQGEFQGCITAEGSMIQSNLLDKKSAPTLFNRAHMQEPYVYLNAKAKIEFKHPALAMVNFVQSSIAIDIYKNNRLQDLGVTGRIIPYFHNKNNVTTSGMPSNKGINIYNQAIIHLLNEYHTQDADAERFEVAVAPDAYSLIKGFEQEIAQSIIPTMPSSAEPCLRKLHGQAVRFAWCIHACLYDKAHLVPITAQKMSQAIELCKCLLPHIHYAYDPCGLQAYDNAIKVIECLRRINTNLGYHHLQTEGIDSRTIQQRSHIKATDLNNALDLLQKHNALAILDNGDRSPKVVLHPQFFNFKWV